METREPPPATPPGIFGDRGTIVAVAVAGLALQVLLWWRSLWIYRDQAELLELGLELAAGGRLAPFGKLMTGDLLIPGVLLELLVGLPLLAWADPRAPVALFLPLHAAAAWILWRILERDLGRSVAGVFLALFWLSPWRLYHAGFLWEPGYLMLPAAVHLAACRALAERPRFAPSAAVGATLALTFQLHASAVVLAAATALLLWRRRIRIAWGGLATGALAGALTLLPTAAAWLGGQRPDRPAVDVELGLRFGSPFKAVLYWLRMGSLDLGRRFRETVFCDPHAAAAGAGDWRLCGLAGALALVAVVSTVIALLAWRRFLGRRSATPRAAWYRGYALAMVGGSMAAALVSPVLLQSWHLLVALPAATLPVAIWFAAIWPGVAGWRRGALALFVLLRPALALLLAFGHPMFATPLDPSVPRHLVPPELATATGGSRVALRSAPGVVGPARCLPTARPAPQPVASAPATRSSRSRASRATPASTGSPVKPPTARKASGSPIRTIEPSPAASTVTLHGSISPTSASRESARWASGGLQAPRIE